MRPESPLRRLLMIRRGIAIAGELGDRRGKAGAPLDGGVELEGEGGGAPHAQAAPQLALEPGGGALEAGEGVFALLDGAQVGDEDGGGAEVGADLDLGDGEERALEARILEVALDQVADSPREATR